VLAALVLAAGFGASHPGPPILLQMNVRESSVQLTLTGEQRIVGPFLGLEAEWPVPFPLTEDVRAQLMRSAKDTFANDVRPLLIDGVATYPTVVHVQGFDDSVPMFGKEHAFELQLEYACTGLPEVIELTWDFFPPDTRGGLPTVPFHAQSEGGRDYFVLSEKDPAFIWRPQPGGPIDLRPVQIEVRHDYGTAGVALALGVLAGALAWATRRRRLAIGLTAAGLLAGSSFVFAARSIRVPEGDEARELFEVLHGRVYAAFDATTDSSVYDLLEVSVDRSILEGIFTGIRDSLVFREDGAGAICQVDAIEYIDVDSVESASTLEAPAFDLVADWRVDGRVIHFAHEHPRRTRYTARFRIAHDGRAWRIAGMQVTSQERESVRGEDAPERDLESSSGD
tara:strand:+ start:189 stop:1376 length:1188 start_codon:yes stop_codon:yes gene_type:complete